MVGGRTTASGWGIELLVVGLCLGMAVWAAYTSVRWSIARRWPAVPCEITRSVVHEAPGPKPYRFQVAYRYARSGRDHLGTVYREDYHGSEDVAEADRLARTYAVGSRHLCHVNPSDPADAFLEGDDPRIPAVLAAFGLFGALIMRGACRRNVWQVGEIAGPVFLVTLGLGSVALFNVRPLAAACEARRWRLSACVVVESRVASEHHGGLFPTDSYWPEVVYRYEVNGVAYRANTHNLTDMGAPWPYSARRVARAYAPGRKFGCFVDPADPSRAVLSRRVSGTQWLGIWPLIIATIGASGIADAALGRKVRVGSPHLWSRIAAWGASTGLLYVFWTSSSVLYADIRDGIAEWPEFTVVGLSGLASAGSLIVLVVLALESRRAAGVAVEYDDGDGVAKGPAKKTSTPIANDDDCEADEEE